jgi:hypothetical protein
MARVAVTVTSLAAGTAVAESAGVTADPTEDHEILAAALTFPLEELLLVFKNTNGSDRVATIVAGDNPPALSAGLGNLDITVPATSGVRMVTGLESARFLQSDGRLEINLATSFAGTVHAYRLGR